ncbi:MAG: hypothetical protein A3F72_05535 [Bacteroidetes bacterium RIFCSPLOWO2_12_FULL_35_15]|nr:MAG: hypothetical protein A3F72_05535 [Bacteroidetes bacterium RIFCSPLOWO2_12_FULL_35_15]
MNKKNKTFLYALLIGFFYLITFTFTYKALENQTIYDKIFSSFMPTYENKNGEINLVKKPFTKITDADYTIMDASHYSYIKDNSYKIGDDVEETKYNFAFFPLFPIVWKFFSNLGIVTLNYFLFIASIIILAYVFCSESINKALLIALTLPTLTVFLLPYTESLFMFSISIGLLGFKRKNNYLLLTGFFLASITRPVFLLFIASAIATSIYILIRDKKIDIKQLIILCIPFIIGTVMVGLYQQTYHNDSFFTFISAQKHWGTYFRLPETINDWSNEGYGMNVWALIFCFVFGIGLLLFNLFKRVKEEVDDLKYWYYFSWIYLVATCVYVLLFQGGCLHSLYRYTLCSPFFFIILFSHLKDFNIIPVKYSISLVIAFFIGLFLFLKMVSYSSNWDFSKLGFILLSCVFLLYIAFQKFKTNYLYIAYSLILAVSIVWNCYLYNMFFCRGWIFL